MEKTKLAKEQSLILFKFLHEYNQEFKNYLKDYECNLYTYYNGYIIPGINRSNILNNMVSKLKTESEIIKGLNGKVGKKDKEYLSILPLLRENNFTIHDLGLFEFGKTKKKFLDSIEIQSNKKFIISSEYSVEYTQDFIFDENYYNKWIMNFINSNKSDRIGSPVYLEKKKSANKEEFYYSQNFNKISEIFTLYHKKFKAILNTKDLFVKKLEDIQDLEFYIEDFENHIRLIVVTDFLYIKIKQFFNIAKGI
jgi:hypothetical protein